MIKVSDEEQKITERIFQLKMSLQLLERARLPFHAEAIRMIKNKIKYLKSEKQNEKNNSVHRDN